MAELKPCPKCGEKPKCDWYYRYDEFIAETDRRFEYCCCNLSTGLYKTEEEAIEEWNRRADNG